MLYTNFMLKIFYIGGEMSLEEKLTWVSILILLISFGSYLTIVLGRAQGIPLVEVPYAGVMFWSLGAGLVSTILVAIATVIALPKESANKDQRDKEIKRYGDAVSYNILALGSLVVLGLTAAQAPHFWIAQSLYLCCVVAGLCGAVVKIIAYRQGF
jgi:hypothetical protein